MSFGGVLDKANTETAKASAKSYALAAETKYIAAKSNYTMSDGTYYANKDSDGSGEKLTGISVSGSLPSGIDDYLIFDDNTLTEYLLTYNNHVVFFIDGISSIYDLDASETLVTPTLTISDLTLQVTSSNTNVASYILYANGSSQGSFAGSTTSVDISTLSNYNLINGQTYNLTLRASSSNPSYKSSNISNPTSFQAFSFIKTPLYEYGNQYAGITGGWVNQIGIRSGSWAVYPAVFNLDHAYLIEGAYGGGWAQSSIRPTNMINYTNYSKLVIDYEISGPVDYMFMAQISNSSSFDYTTFYNFDESRANPAGTYTKKLNLSSVYNGNAYLKITLITGVERPCLTYDNLKIYKIYLLKKSYS